MHMLNRNWTWWQYLQMLPPSIGIFNIIGWENTLGSQARSKLPNRAYRNRYQGRNRPTMLDKIDNDR